MADNALQITQQNNLIIEYANKLSIATGQIEVIKKTYAPTLSNDEFLLFMGICAQTNLIPGRDIHAIKYKEKLSLQVSIDGLGKIAMATGQYDGHTAPDFCGLDGKWQDVWLEAIPPMACRVQVFRKDCKHSFQGLILFSEYNTGSPIWKQKACHMMAKCALAQALRRAFPGEMSGQYIPEEMENIDTDIEQPVKPRYKPPKIVPEKSPEIPVEAISISAPIPEKFLPAGLKDLKPSFMDLAENPEDYRFNTKAGKSENGHWLLRFFATTPKHPCQEIANDLLQRIQARQNAVDVPTVDITEPPEPPPEEGNNDDNAQPEQD